MIKLKNNIEDLLDSLSKSKFRGSFHLNKKMKDYVKEKGFDKIKLDARFDNQKNSTRKSK